MKMKITLFAFGRKCASLPTAFAALADIPAKAKYPKPQATRLRASRRVSHDSKFGLGQLVQGIFSLDNESPATRKAHDTGGPISLRRFHPNVPDAGAQHPPRPLLARGPESFDKPILSARRLPRLAT